MRKLSMVAISCVVGFLVSCDSSSSPASGSATNGGGDATGLVGRWEATYKSGQIKPANNILVFSANGSYLNTQTPPLTVYSYFFRDSGSWVASHDTVKFCSFSYKTSFDSGKTWNTKPPDSARLPYSITGNQLILVGKDLDNGSDVLNYFVKD